MTHLSQLNSHNWMQIKQLLMRTLISWRTRCHVSFHCLTGHVFVWFIRPPNYGTSFAYSSNWKLVSLNRDTQNINGIVLATNPPQCTSLTNMNHLESEARPLPFILGTFFFDQFLCKHFLTHSFSSSFFLPIFASLFCRALSVQGRFFFDSFSSSLFFSTDSEPFFLKIFSLQAFFLDAFSSQVFLLSSRPAPQPIGCNDHPRQAQSLHWNVAWIMFMTSIYISKWNQVRPGM